jgi:multiple sugar transport system permease protein
METAVQQTVRVEPRRQPQFHARNWGLGRILAFVLMIAISLLFLVPLAWMISTSLKEAGDLAGTHWIPRRLAFENYRDAFSFGMWPQWTWNSIVITVSSVIGMVLSSSLVAYSFARLRWRGRDALFSVVLATMMLPSVVTMIPQFVLFAKLPAFGFQGSRVWTNTFLPLIVPAFTGGAFYIFLLRQFMRSIPMELSEAAKIDGASELRIWWSIIMPLTRPALATVAIFTFQGAWQDFMGPLLYLQSERLYTLQLGLRQFEAAAGGSPAWNWLMAASLMVMLPVLVVFLTLQRNFIEGISLSGMGGR